LNAENINYNFEYTLLLIIGVFVNWALIERNSKYVCNICEKWTVDDEFYINKMAIIYYAHYSF
jgi:hypothetical protein